MRAIAIFSGSLALALGGACADTASYYYSPEAADVTRSGVPTHIEKIPSELPQGTVEISTMGLQKDKNGQRLIHVEMVVSNEGDQIPWTIDVRNQLIDIPGVGQRGPEFVNAPMSTLPTLTAPRRERRKIDLYYPTPPNVSSASDLTAFDFLWQVDTPHRDVSGRTRIAREEVVEPPSTLYVDSFGWGPYWWYDPWYPTAVYYPYRTRVGMGGPYYHHH